MICTSRKYSDEIPCIVVKTFVEKNMQWGPILIILLFSDIYHWNDKLSESSPIPGSDLLRASLMHVPHQRWRDFSGSHHSSSSSSLQNISWSQVQPHLLSVLSPLLATLLAQAGSHPTITLPCSEALLRLNNAPTFHKISHFPPSGTSLLLS